jgi:hypothetical protein
MEKQLDHVKDIIRSSRFQLSSESEQQKFLNQIVTTGEVSIEDVMSIYNNVYLETLPYNVFLNIILNGDISGINLLNLCNSSPLINNQCNKSFKSEDTGETIPQYLFVLLLRKAGINYEQIIKRKPNLLPRNVYYYYFVGDGVRFNRLKDKLIYMAVILKQDTFIPDNLYDLLYNNNEFEKGTRFFKDLLNVKLKNLERFNYSNYILQDVENEFQDEFLDPEQSSTSLTQIAEIEEKTGIAAKELLLDSFKSDSKNPHNIKRFHLLFPGSEFTLQNYVTIVRNNQEYFRRYLLGIPGIADYDKLLKTAQEAVNTYIEYIISSKYVSIDHPKLPDIDHSKLLDNDDIIYIIKLHMRVLRGELKLNTPFQIDQLF